MHSFIRAFGVCVRGSAHPVWHTEQPVAWRVYGLESPALKWELVDTFKGPRTEPATYKFMNKTCDNPGFYRYYRWVFSDWAPARGNGAYTSDGYRFRELILNPNGFAMHYGAAMAKPAREKAPRRVALGLSNVAFGKPAYQRSEYATAFKAENAVDGSLGDFQFNTNGKSALSGLGNGKHEYLVVDLLKQHQVQGVAVYSVHNAYERALITAGGGTVVGMSDGWDAKGSPFDSGNHQAGTAVHRGHYDWATVWTKDCWARQDCGTNPNVTRCGAITKPAVSDQYFVNCNGARVCT